MLFNFGSFIRRSAFWSIDFLKGRPIRKAYNDVKYERENNVCNQQKLENILEYASKNVNFYKDKQYTKLQDFPVVSKEDYKNNYDAFVSDEYRETDKLYKTFTSGSTGTPFCAIQDLEKRIKHYASLIHLNESIGWKLGRKFLQIRERGGNTNSLKDFFQNTIVFSPTNLNRIKIKQIENTIRKKKSLKILQSYASSLHKLVDYIYENGLETNDYGLELIISDTDKLSEPLLVNLMTIFECPIYDRYGNNENGIIALKKNKNDYLVNTADFYVETLKLDSDMPVSKGERGRIVVTDFYNKAFPFIRYDTGDIGIANKQSKDQVVSLKEITGRNIDFVKTPSGKKIFVPDITSTFKYLFNIKKYQIIQDTQNYKITLKVVTKDVQEGKKGQYKLERLTDNECEIEIQNVSEIPVEKNGKYKIIKKI